MALPRLTKEETISKIRQSLLEGWSIHVAKKRAFVRPTYEREVLNKDPEYVKLVYPYRKNKPKNPNRQGMDIRVIATPPPVPFVLPGGKVG